ncbi:hypothetical protein E2562_001937 [Oryza meyeriana var. granulata]|uniref:Uncharacterized protein n=1 Tax=Oryza meyeriana var. granulata TaxID=110450 RepID=A0A6G1C395_9ORYZ|nr:hypothetical protein E2562_001937 [Oryza meyeriana var. granulata]
MRPGGRRRCQLLGGDTAAFCASLVDGLAHLESSLLCEDDVDGGGGGGGGAVSMRWCADAMRLVKRMQRELLVMFKKADVPVGRAISYRGGGGDDGGGGCWFEHYMQETAALLDFCNAFKSAVSRLHRYCMVVDFAAQVGCAAAGVRLVAENGAGGWLEEEPADDAVRGRLPDVKAVVSETERLGRKIMSSSSSSAGDDAGGMVVVMLVAKITMAVVSMFVLQALTSPIIPLATDGRCTLGCAAVPVPELQPWRESLSVITDRFPRRPSVAEHERVAMVVKSMMLNTKMEGEVTRNVKQQQEEDDEMVRHVELLRTRSGELRSGVEMFDCVLDEVFDEVIKGRNEMLGIFRDKALTLG